MSGTIRHAFLRTDPGNGDRLKSFSACQLVDEPFEVAGSHAAGAADGDRRQLSGCNELVDFRATDTEKVRDVDYRKQ